MGAMVAEQGGDRKDIFRDLLTHREQVFRICLGFAKNPQDAEELAQEAYLKAYKHKDSIKAPFSAKGWLLRIARNTCLDHQKKFLHIRPLSLEEAGEPADDCDIETHRARNEKLEMVKDAVEQLPRKLKEVFVLREYGELTYVEMSAALGTSLGTIMSRLNRARRAVINLVKEASDGKRT
jgi:RNA polymerase sigma-70 factor (ECF subfamily)